MAQKASTRRHEQVPTGSQNMFAGVNITEITHNNLLVHQAARIAGRFDVSAAVARVVAEHAYASGGSA